MDNFSDYVEYYDELYPISDSLKKYCENLKQKSNFSPRALQIGCNTGTFCFHLARSGWDSTGTETIQPLLDSANTKKRTQLLSIRFFKLSTTEMNKFLGKKFYNAIFCLDGRITLLQNRENLKNFFTDSKTLLADNGQLIISTFNLENFKPNTTVSLADKKTIRVDKTTIINIDQQENAFLTTKLITGSNRISPVFTKQPIFPLTKKDILSFGKDAGFSNINFYRDFDLSPFNEKSDLFIAILS